MSAVCDVSLIEKIVSQASNPEYYRISKPWYQPGLLCVTDGRILIVFDADSPPEGMDVVIRDQCEKGKNPPDANPILAQIRDEIPDTLPAVNGPDEDWTPRWESTGECYKCCGTGEVECDMGHDHECDQCEGGECIGEVPEARERILIRDREFARKYIWILSQLPELKLHDAQSEHMIGFTFSGGRGCLAGYSEEQ